MLKQLFLAGILSILSASVYAQEQHVFQSKNLAKPDTVLVFKPKKLTANDKPQMIFLLHGYNGNYKQWDSFINAQRYADMYNFVIVCPDGLIGSWYLNSPADKKSQYENFFFDELYPEMVSKYNADERKIFITGLSMGGHGAMHLFIKRPELFASAGSTSGGVSLRDFSKKYGLSTLLGSKSQDDKVWDEFSVVTNIRKLQGNPKPFIFDCGSDDFFYKYNNELKQICDELKLNATYISQPGAHNKGYWRKSIKQQFDFFAGVSKEIK